MGSAPPTPWVPGDLRVGGGVQPSGGPKLGGTPLFGSQPCTQWGLWERAAALNPCGAAGRLKGAQARRRSPRDRRRTEVCCSLELVPYVTD